ncbi:hypothetical protein D3C76_858670 [compost metagenome]
MFAFSIEQATPQRLVGIKHPVSLCEFQVELDVHGIQLLRAIETDAKHASMLGGFHFLAHS